MLSERAMPGGEPLRDVFVFVTLYLLLSLPPFLALNPDLSPKVVQTATIALLGTGLLAVVAGLFLAREGVDRFVQFLLAPTDLLSVVVLVAFVAAAVSWWAVPEVAFYYELGLTLDVILGAIIVSQIPMVLFLSLMTAIGKTEGP